MEGKDVVTVTVPSSGGEELSLLIIDEGGSRRATLAVPGTAVIGRAQDCDIQLADSSASRHHARLSAERAGVTIADLESHNGTRVNGRRISGALRLAAGDVIAIGSSTIVVRVPEHQPTGDTLDREQALTRLDRELARSRRHGRPLSIVLVELPRAPGPDTIAVISEALAAEHTVAPLDERTLLLVLPECAATSAGQLAAGVRSIAQVAVSDARTAVASFPHDGSSAASLVAAARAMLAGDPRSLEVGDRTIVVADPAMVQTYELLNRLARSEISVLVTGETGAGKEMAAMALHAWSPRASGPFVAVDCASLPDALVESELFGHEKGAFSGADRAKPGQIERAHGGTLFLDEIGELPLAAQAKLLRTLEQRALMRVGATTTIPIDFRLVAATNRDPRAEITSGRFREDLYFRVAAAAITLPPLRERPQDIPLLARTFLGRACARLGRPPASLSDATLRLLASHAFPGNVRELVNAMEYAAATSAEDLIEPHHLPATIAAPMPATSSRPSRFRPIADELEELERRRMAEALEATGGNQSHAAELIDMPRRTFVTKLRRYNLKSD